MAVDSSERRLVEAGGARAPPPRLELVSGGMELAVRVRALWCAAALTLRSGCLLRLP